MQGDREERIRRRAHEIWEREGRPEGEHDAHWARACAEIDDEDRAGDVSAANVVKKVVRRTKKAAAAAIGAGVNAVVDVVEEALDQKKPRARKAKAEDMAVKPAAAKPGTAKPARGKGAKAANDKPAGAKPRRKSGAGQNSPVVH